VDGRRFFAYFLISESRGLRGISGLSSAHFTSTGGDISGFHPEILELCAAESLIFVNPLRPRRPLLSEIRK
jgi:hypothetical protein